MKRTPPIQNPPPLLRQRYVPSRGTWRIWWEPSRKARALGYPPVVLDADRLTWSVRQAERLNAQLQEKKRNVKPSLCVRPAAARCISTLIDRYCASPKFRDGLRHATRADYEAAFRSVKQRFGSRDVSGIRKPEIVAWYETIYPAGASQAKRLVRAASILFSYAETIGWIAEGANPCLRLQLVTPKPRGRVANWDEVGALLRVCATPGLIQGVQPGALISMGTAIALTTFNGQRQSDVIAVTADQVEGNVWRIERSKRGQAGVFELHEFARPWVTRARDMSAKAGLDQLILYEGTRRPYQSQDHFGEVFRRVRAQAFKNCDTIRDLQFRDLRRTSSQMARLGGADGHQTGDLLGNASERDPRLSITYMPADETAATAAVRAIQPPPELAIFPEGDQSS